MAERFCRVCKSWHDLNEPWPVECVQVREVAVSDIPSPMLSLDTMDPVQSQLDGKMYDSKSRLRATYKAAGMVEVGNDSSVTDPKPYKRPKVKREDVKASVDKAFSRAGLGA